MEVIHSCLKGFLPSSLTSYHTRKFCVSLRLEINFWSGFYTFLNTMTACTIVSFRHHNDLFWISFYMLCFSSQKKLRHHNKKNLLLNGTYISVQNNVMLKTWPIYFRCSILKEHTIEWGVISCSLKEIRPIHTI